jgi:hypothetical protein
MLLQRVTRQLWRAFFFAAAVVVLLGQVRDDDASFAGWAASFYGPGSQAPYDSAHGEKGPSKGHEVDRAETRIHVLRRAAYLEARERDNAALKRGL